MSEALTAIAGRIHQLSGIASPPSPPVEPPVEILGTDISTHVLGRAWDGRYGVRALRHVDPVLHRRYLVPDEGQWAVGPQLKRLVEFRRHNLVRDPIPPLGEELFDLI